MHLKKKRMTAVQPLTYTIEATARYLETYKKTIWRYSSKEEETLQMFSVYNEKWFKKNLFEIVTHKRIYL